MIDLSKMRQAQHIWAATPIADRLHIIKAFRRLVGDRAEWLAHKIATRPVADTLAAEVLPLADGAKFLHRRAKSILAERAAGGLAPAWLPGIRAGVRRIPLGVVLIVGPGNYPLFLPAIQVLQALAAGNAVAVKPAPDCTAPMAAFADLLMQAGLPAGLLTLLPEASGPDAVAAGFDHIVFTGSADTGRHVLRAAAETLTPCTMELSGCDAAFVLPGADIALVARSLVYGLRLNGGASCIAPRRVFVTQADAAKLEHALLEAARGVVPAPLPNAIVDRANTLLAAARRAGARITGSPAAMCPPLLVFDAVPSMELLKADLFAPWLAIVAVPTVDAMIASDAACPYALGASIWGPSSTARRFVRHMRALSICINDAIAPTADPRLPFGGRAKSGFGTTRGPEGLLAMTLPQAISRRVVPLRPHLLPPRWVTPKLLARMARWLHSDWRKTRSGSADRRLPR